MAVGMQHVSAAIRSLRRIRPVMHNRGGWINTWRQARALYQREGLAGVRRGVRALSRQITAPRHDYAEWVRRYDTLTDTGRTMLRARMSTWPDRPLISIVMPVHDPKIAWLEEAIESVRGQAYSSWELCIADDASTSEAVRSTLTRHARQDPRIKVVFRKQNGHISAASNSALELAGGQWVALLDHDDVLPEDALFWVADAIANHPDARLVYSDEDKITGKGVRLDPYFKCDWNRTLFYSHNLITHLGVYQRQLLQDIGGFRLGFEGAQDYDLALRCIERLAPTQIHHIPRVLYHWRMHRDSTSTRGESKPYAMAAGQKALNDHFLRTNVNATATLIGHGFRVRYRLPAKPPRVSIIIATRNAQQLVKQCVDSITHLTDYPDYEIVLIDNGSDDADAIAYFAQLANQPGVRVLRDARPFNYSALNNMGVAAAEGDYVVLMNNDIQVISPGWLAEMASHAIQPGVGAVGARLWYPNDTLQHAGVVLGVGGWAGHSHKGLRRGHPGYAGRVSLASEFSAVTGACLMVSKALYREFGGLNEQDLAVACNDVDFCLRLSEAGYRNVFTPYAELYHHESATRGYEDTPEKAARFRRELDYMQTQWGARLQNDPAYSANLTLEHEDFSLAWPPRVEPLNDPPHDAAHTHAQVHAAAERPNQATYL